MKTESQTSKRLRSVEEILQAYAALQKEASECWLNAVQGLVNKYKVHLATGQMSDVWQVRRWRGRKWLHEWDDHDEHPIFAELKALDKAFEELGIGPTNMERFEPMH